MKKIKCKPSSWSCCVKGKILSLSVAILLTAFTLQFSSGFSLSKIALDLPQEISIEPPLPLLSEPYTYLSHGRQSFVFESADHQTVIKFFNQTYFKPKWYRIFFFSEKAKEKYQKKIALRQKFYHTSYPLAMKEMPFETGILYVHLGPSQTKLPKLSLIDPSGRKLIVDLNQTAFVLQKKANSYLEYMQEVLQKEGASGLKREIDRWLLLSQQRIERGILDNDHDIWNNVGILEGSIFFIDPGKFYREKIPLSPKALHLEWWKATHRLYRWLLTNNLEAASYLYSKTSSVCTLQKPPE